MGETALSCARRGGHDDLGIYLAGVLNAQEATAKKQGAVVTSEIEDPVNEADEELAMAPDSAFSEECGNMATTSAESSATAMMEIDLESALRDVEDVENKQA